LALHSFWYDEARDEFQAATKAAPEFAMGYWGEALTHYHFVWEQEDVVKAKAALDKLPAALNVTQREKMFIDAARVLVGDGEREPRWKRYAEAMRAVHLRYPDDDEAATLFAVSLLGAAGRKTPGFKHQAEAGAIGLEVLSHNPDHPGAAHYVIHAFDDPDHAILALPAARRYAQIAPEAYHARHMPSHIFVQLGMWNEAAASNESSWAASDALVKRKGGDVTYHDYHSLSWLEHISIEQGRFKRADEVLALAKSDLDAAKKDRASVRITYAFLAIDNAVSTDAVERLEALLAPLAKPEPPSTESSTIGGCHSPAEVASAQRMVQLERGTLAYARGLTALAKKDGDGFTKAMATLVDAQSKLTDPYARDGLKQSELELRGRRAAQQGKLEEALTKLRAATELEEREPPSGPAFGVTARERLGEVLLANRRAAEALAAFRRSLELHPRRARALVWAAKAATATGDTAAAAAYRAELAQVWAGGDEPQRRLADAMK
jgi:tetratricopeptide (TPR) repeat protein